MMENQTLSSRSRRVSGQKSLMGIDLTREPGCLEKEDRFGSTLSVPTRDGKTAPSHLSAQISRSAEYERIFALERKLGNGGSARPCSVRSTGLQTLSNTAL